MTGAAAAEIVAVGIAAQARRMEAVGEPDSAHLLRVVGGLRAMQQTRDGHRLRRQQLTEDWAPHSPPQFEVARLRQAEAGRARIADLSNRAVGELLQFTKVRLDRAQAHRPRLTERRRAMRKLGLDISPRRGRRVRSSTSASAVSPAGIADCAFVLAV